MEKPKMYQNIEMNEIANEEASNSFFKVKDLVLDTINKVKSNEIQKEDLSDNWVSYFRYSENPLQLLDPKEKFDREQLTLFVNRVREIELLSKYIGMAKELKNPLHLAIIGSKGIGKHTTLKIISEIIENSLPEITFEFYDQLGLYNYKKSRSLTSREITELNAKKLDMRIYCYAGKNKDLLLERIHNFKKNTKLTISVWNASEYSTNEDLLIDKKMFFENFSNGQIEEILMKRIENTLQISNHTREYFNSLKDATIPEIIKNCKGNLRLAFKLFEILHQHATNKKVKAINETLISEAIKNINLIREIKLTNKEKEILNYYLQNPKLKFITTTHLVEELDYNRTLAWNYLERLVQKGVLRNIQYGKPSKYQLNELFTIIYEERLMKKMVKTFF
jgi:hypothetical protein